MSPQQVTFVVCLSIVAFVALVSGQGFNPNGCSESAQKSVSNFNSKVTKSVANMVSKLSKHGQETANVDKFTEKANAMMTSLGEAANSENLTDASKVAKVGTKLMEQYLDMASLVFTTEPITKAIPIYTGFVGEMMPMYAELMTNMISACGPTGSGRQ